MSFQSIIEEAEGKIEEMLMNSDEFKTCEPEGLGLDRRASYAPLYVSHDEIVVSGANNLRVLSYYGGFEYVDKDYVTSIGKFTCFSREDERVALCIDRANGVLRNEAGDDDEE